MTNYKTVVTGVDDGQPNIIGKFKCEHCGEWVEEAEENGDDYLCLECLKEYAKCSKCGKYELIYDRAWNYDYNSDSDWGLMFEMKRIAEDKDFLCTDCLKVKVYSTPVIAVDFDGTLAVTEYPKIIRPITQVIELVNQYHAKGAIIILWTCRVGKHLDDAVQFCKENGILIDLVNENTKDRKELYGSDCRKISADVYIDDRSVFTDHLGKNDISVAKFFVESILNRYKENK